MTVSDQILNQTELLVGQLEDTDRERLRLLCRMVEGTLSRQLREDVTVEDCREDFVTAASILAVSQWSPGEDVAEFRAGDLTVKKGQRFPEHLKTQAFALLRPYLKSAFAFLGV